VRAVRGPPYRHRVAHPPGFDPDDPYLQRVRALALALPDAAEKVSHGRPTFFTTKVFAYYGGSTREAGKWVQHGQAVLVLPEALERQALLAEDRCFVPAYLGPSGWVGVEVDQRTDWDEVAELLEDSYRRTAGVRRVARLDARS
jgi:predicted DNA-binding protein (MmcQ/YjbR family)